VTRLHSQVMDFLDALLLLVGGFAAAVINTIAGGGSLLTVPLLVLAGAPGTVANGTNRVGILAGTFNAARTFSHLGVQGMKGIGAILVPAAVGSVVGSVLVSRLADDAFERTFGILMIPVLLLSLKRPNTETLGDRPNWPRRVTTCVFFAIGLYGGAFQAGVGLLFIVALARSGVDLVIANHIKVITTLVFTLLAIPVFLLAGQIDWALAVPLAVGFGAGGWVGARLTVAGGERLVRPVLVLAVVALSGRLLGLY
jgi:uncharacterized membrane protein YfcA